MAAHIKLVRTYPLGLALVHFKRMLLVVVNHDLPVYYRAYRYNMREWRTKNTVNGEFIAAFPLVWLAALVRVAGF